MKLTRSYSYPEKCENRMKDFAFLIITTKFCKIKETEKLKQKSQDKYYISKTNNKNPAGAPHHINKTYYRDYHEYKKEKTH